ncbi:putative quinol monooxygenase [Tropicimonas sediminicola]|uniref:Quinol monooxygenase YgiN n=1 Tax=Tropicimonas sediminicola TaxID=1031541 RepID=A0A239LL20_9RHOB|nr:putative quinol monooxygenase [Tropicimonas sediminicola]SNT31266.1 Quinol monooxygenase YgiN [Tropicimonas sediminicola]
MFVVTVSIEVNAGQVDAFLPLMLQNARASLSSEPGCRQFDVYTNPERPEAVFLFEVYDSAAAFDAHLSSDHFKQFDRVTAEMIASKQVETFTEVQG